MLIFEETVSTLYYSNDGRLHVTRHKHPENGTWVFTIVRYDESDPTLAVSPVPVFSTYDSVKADAYIAGYDLATERAA